jgi:hypothetical protein
MRIVRNRDQVNNLHLGFVSLKIAVFLRLHRDAIIFTFTCIHLHLHLYLHVYSCVVTLSSACRSGCRLLQRSLARFRMRRRVRLCRCCSESIPVNICCSYMEELIEKARHIEVQCVGDGTGRIVTLGERECSLQRKQQKIIEVTPSPSLSPRMREQLQGNVLSSHAFFPNFTLTSTTSAAAIRLMAADPPLSSLCTVEFLVRENDFWFIEANPRLQVEHTVTEAVFDLDLVALQVARSCHA